MQLKASIDYALRAVIYLAMEGKVVSSKRISEEIAVPRDYLIQLSQLLRNAGIIDAKAGKNGGYVLAKDPQKISFLEIIRAIDDATKPVKADPIKRGAASGSGAEPPLVEGIHKALDLAFSSFDAYLDGITIDMLVRCAKDAENVDVYLGEQLIKEGERLEAKAKGKPRHGGQGASGVIPSPSSVTVISSPAHDAAAVASTSEVPAVASTSPAAQVESKTELP